MYYRMHHQKLHARRGAAYLVALLAGMIVSVTGLAALSVATTRARTAESGDQFASARLNANTAMQHALAAVSAHLSNGGTRDDIPNAEPTVLITEGSARWRLREIDGSALDAEDGPIVIEARGDSGAAVFALDALLVPSGVPIDALDTALYVDGNLNVSALADLVADHVVFAGGDLGSSGSIDADVEAGGRITGSGYAGSVTEDAPSRLKPTPGLIEEYAVIGTRINLTSLPIVFGARSLSSVLLSKNSNPFGSPDPLGIYVIDCGGESIAINSLRIEGTLVLLNTGPSTTIAGGTLMSPAHPWLPTLLVDGDINFMGSNTGPSESVVGANLNPASTPWQFEHDTDTDDVYPGRIEGVSYVDGDMTVSVVRQNFKGAVLVEGDLRVLLGADLHIEYDPTVAHLTPLGFFLDEGGLAVDPATVAWTLP